MPRRRSRTDYSDQPRTHEKDTAVLSFFRADEWGSWWSPFENKEDAESYWRVHRERLLERCRERHPGKRPPIWWELEAPRDRPVFAEDRPDGAPRDLANEAAWLLELLELSEEEREHCDAPNPAELLEMRE